METAVKAGGYTETGNPGNRGTSLTRIVAQWEEARRGRPPSASAAPVTGVRSPRARASHVLSDAPDYMKMSLCNTFRFFAVFTTVVLSIAGSPVPELVSRQNNIGTKKISPDLEHQGSLTVELKSDDKRPNYINSLKLNNVKGDTNSMSLDSESTKKTVNKNSYQTIVTTDDVAQDNGAKNIETTTSSPLDQVTKTFLSTTTLNITLASPEETVNNSIRFKNMNPVNISKPLEKIASAKQMRSQNNNTINENLIKEKNSNTTIKLENSTQTTLLDIGSTINTKTETETSLPVTDTEDTIATKSSKLMKLSSLTSKITAPTWKKYSVIERKRVLTTTDEAVTSTVSTLSEEATTVTEKSEVMVKSESAQGRISLQDAITSDIPSLDKLKSDLLSFPKFTTESDTESTRSPLSTEDSIAKTDVTSFITNFSSTLSTESPNTVSSKRAGYLDLSAKNSTVDDVSLKPNDTEALQGPFDAETPDTQDEILDDKDKRAESQSQLAEDAIKEELLKEEILNDSEEISKRHRNEGKQIETYTPALSDAHKANTTQFDDKPLELPHAALDENLSVKPINSDKAKNTVTLYPVNPNYKPLKKIEVQPAKPFVRDPDDNSWRNESLSSLGIVFKPKNSSKPFTQVLKNKTETEWNNLPEKDMKSEVPDLRVRLEQIAQKRKSKKKKIDSFGNVFYTDYEENSSSEENSSTPQAEEPTFSTVSTTDVTTSGITIVTPIQTTTSTSSSPPPVLEENDVPALTTTAAPTDKTQTTPKKAPTKVTTLKRPKLFNLFDYYETNDDEDIADYLNMAKIDLKKYTVPIQTTFTPFTSPPLPILYTNPMTEYTPERKGTIQYFPPRTTKRPKKNKYNNIQNKINPLTVTDSPKHVLPISYHKLTTPYDSSVYYTNVPDVRYKEELVPKNFDRNMYLTTPPLTTVPEEFGVVGNDGGYDRPGYVIKHYKDFMNEAAPERSNHREYSFTEQPGQDVTATDFIKPTTTKDKTFTEDYDYESEFRKDLLNRFVANFNEKSNRFKSDFPVVYNNSIVHGVGYDDKDVAMSRAYFRRPYDNREYKPAARDPYDPNCENVTVELSPAYELHYYVPEQEEKQEVEAKPINLPVRYRL